MPSRSSIWDLSKPDFYQQVSTEVRLDGQPFYSPYMAERMLRALRLLGKVAGDLQGQPIELFDWEVHLTRALFGMLHFIEWGGRR